MDTNSLQSLNVDLPLIGTIVSAGDDHRSFVLRTRGGTDYEVFIRDNTSFQSVKNLDLRERNRVLKSPGGAPDYDQSANFAKYVVPERLIAVQGVLLMHNGRRRYDATSIINLTSSAGYYLYEHTHWWMDQIRAIGKKWLDDLFPDRRSYTADDFSRMYRTRLTIEGGPTGDDTQEMATLARLIYGFSSAYLLTGDERFFQAARAGVQFQCREFKSFSKDRRYCFWLHARQRKQQGWVDVLESLNPEDLDTIPLYEQIYALAGLAQYYRITNDRDVFIDIRDTVRSIDRLFADRIDGDHRGFFSHLDEEEKHWDSLGLERTNNRAKKNWNSIGDHLPAYLINVILALDPLPATDDEAVAADLQSFLDKCKEILDVTSQLILEKFPEDGNPFVNERFKRDFTPEKDHGWQQNLGVVGHNLKIAWNLTRVANYYLSKQDDERAARLFALCRRIGGDMARLGLDQNRSGVFDAVERVPRDGEHFPVEFGWKNTKDFWQEEQGILAYLIMFGYLRDPTSDESASFLTASRELCAFWNIYCLDRERASIFFRTSDNGTPVIEGQYGEKGSHSLSGYHVFELNYLADLYQRAFLPRKNQKHTVFCLHFRPSQNRHLKSINVLPDFLGPDAVEIDGISVDGIERTGFDRTNFQIPIDEADQDRDVIVRFRQSEAAFARLSPHAPDDDRFQ